MTTDVQTSPEYFCGRERELCRIVDYHRSGIKHRSGGVCLVSGPPGIGKTSFCHKLLEELPRAGLFPLVLKYYLSGSEDSDRVCASLLRQAEHQRPNDDPFEGLSPYQRTVLSAHLPGVVVGGADFPRGEVNPRATAAVWRQCLLDVGRREDFGLVVYIDDLHLAPESLWEFLSGVCRQALVDRVPLWVWAGFRRTGATADAARRADDLMTPLREEAEFTKSLPFTVSDLRLQALTEHETGQVLDRYFGGGFAASYSECAQCLQERSSGNPFYLGLLIRACVRQGLVERDGSGAWTYRADRSGTDLGAIDDLLARRVMEALAEPALARPLRLAVALGDVFLFDDWMRSLNLARTEAVELLLSLQRRGVLADFMIGAEHRVQFAHPLLLEAFRSVLPPAEQRSSHALAAEHFSGSDRPVQATDHLIAAGAPAEAIARTLRDSMPAAFSQNRLSRILAWAEKIDGLAPADQAQLYFYALKSARLMGKVGEAIGYYEKLARYRDSLTAGQDIEARASVSSALFAVEPKRAMEVLEEGLAAHVIGGPAGNAGRETLILHKYFLLADMHLYQQAIALGEDLLALDPENDDLVFRVQNTMGGIFLRQGRWDEADRLLRDLVLPLARRRSEDELCKAMEVHGSVLVRLCRFAEAEDLFTQELDIAEKHARIASVASALNSRGNIYLRQGRYKKALADKERAARIAFTTGNQEQLASCLNDIAGIKMEMGEQAGVIELFQRSLRLKESQGNRAGCATTGTNIAMCYLRGTGTAVDPRRALEWALRANGILRELNYTVNLVDNLATISQAYLALGERSQALDYAGQALAAADRQPTPYNRATALAQKGAVLCALGSPGAEGVLRESAALFGDVGNRHEQAGVLLRLAEQCMALGKTGPAREALLTVRDIYLELKLDPALARLIDRYPDLLGNGARPAPAASAANLSGLRIQVLGPFRIWPAGANRPLADKQWGSRLGRRIMAYLLTTGFSARGGIDRDKLLDIFWNDAGAGGSLRVILHRLRKSLNYRDAVLFEGGKYSFNWRLADVRFDREQMETLYKNGLALAGRANHLESWEQLERAEALFGGEYLEDINEPWAMKTRKALRTTRRTILKKLIELSTILERPEAASFYQNKLTSTCP